MIDTSANHRITVTIIDVDSVETFGRARAWRERSTMKKDMQFVDMIYYKIFQKRNPKSHVSLEAQIRYLDF